MLFVCLRHGLCSPSWLRSHCVAQAIPKFMAVLLSQPLSAGIAGINHLVLFSWVESLRSIIILLWEVISTAHCITKWAYLFYALFRSFYLTEWLIKMWTPETLKVLRIDCSLCRGAELSPSLALPVCWSSSCWFCTHEGHTGLSVLNASDREVAFS